MQGGPGELSDGFLVHSFFDVRRSGHATILDLRFEHGGWIERDS